MAKKKTEGNIKYHLVSSNVRKGLYSRVKACVLNNGYALRFAVEVGLIMFLKATHEERMETRNSFVYKGRPKDKELRTK